MKKLVITLLGLSALAATGYAGPAETSSGKDLQQQSYSAPATDFYRDKEWNIDLFATRADTYNSYRNDQYLGVDHAYGGGIDANYMFTRYLGAGLEGYALDGNDAIGQASANFIFRYPIPGTRFAPYGYAGGGVLFNGSHIDRAIDNGHSPEAVRDRSDAEGVGQVGAGFEIRFTPHIGLINDYSYNLVNGPDNNYGLIRSGIRFAF